MTLKINYPAKFLNSSTKNSGEYAIFRCEYRWWNVSVVPGITVLFITAVKPSGRESKISSTILVSQERGAHFLDSVSLPPSSRPTM